MTRSAIPGYDYGSPSLARSPVAMEDVATLRASLLLGDDDVAPLRRAREILAPQTDAILDVWYGFVADNPHLLAAFARPDGEPDGDYLAAVRARFAQWILDTCDARYDQAWLDWQHEIALRHHRTKKNRTDGADAAAILPFRHLVALTYPIYATLRPFLEQGGVEPAEVEAMHQAWLKAVLLQVILWSRPYVHDDDF